MPPLSLTKGSLDKVALSEGKSDLITFYSREGMAERVRQLLGGDKESSGKWLRFVRFEGYVTIRGWSRS